MEHDAVAGIAPAGCPRGAPIRSKAHRREVGDVQVRAVGAAPLKLALGWAAVRLDRERRLGAPGRVDALGRDASGRLAAPFAITSCARAEAPS
jgi:hypothetical protein